MTQLVTLTMLLVSGLLTGTAWAQAPVRPVTPIVPAPSAGAPVDGSGWIMASILVIGLLVVVGALVKIFDLRRNWPPDVGLSITALASWCISDTWIKDLPIDEAVPMLFRMGADNNQIRLHLKSGGDFNLDLCRNSIGISTDEAIDDLPIGRRIYIFNTQSWTQQSVNKALTTARQKDGQ